MHLHSQVFQIKHKSSCILELYSVRKHSYCRVHRTEIISMSKHINQTFAQCIKFRVVIRSETIWTSREWSINMQSQPLNQNIIVFPNVFLFRHTECVSWISLPHTYSWNFKHIYPKITDMQLYRIAFPKHQQSSVCQQTSSRNACLFAKIFWWQFVVWEIRIDIGYPVSVSHQRMLIQHLNG